MDRDATDFLHRCPPHHRRNGSDCVRSSFSHAHGNPGSNADPHRDFYAGADPCTQTHAVIHSNSDCGYYTSSHSIDNSKSTCANLAADSDSSRCGHADTIDNWTSACAYAHSSPHD